jgi:hypothetical protein
MTPRTRSSMKILKTAAEEWRFIEGGESKRLTTEEMNDFVVQNSSLKQEIHSCYALLRMRPLSMSCAESVTVHFIVVCNK